MRGSNQKHMADNLETKPGVSTTMKDFIIKNKIGKSLSIADQAKS